MKRLKVIKTSFLLTTVCPVYSIQNLQTPFCVTSTLLSIVWSLSLLHVLKLSINFLFSYLELLTDLNSWFLLYSKIMDPFPTTLVHFLSYVLFIQFFISPFYRQKKEKERGRKGERRIKKRRKKRWIKIKKERNTNFMDILYDSFIDFKGHIIRPTVSFRLKSNVSSTSSLPIYLLSP